MISIVALVPRAIDVLRAVTQRHLELSVVLIVRVAFIALFVDRAIGVSFEVCCLSWAYPIENCSYHGVLPLYDLPSNTYFQRLLTKSNDHSRKTVEHPTAADGAKEPVDIYKWSPFQMRNLLSFFARRRWYR